MRDFSKDISALSLNTATLGNNIEGHGAGWAPEKIIDACAARGFGGVVFWRRELGDRAAEIGRRVHAAGLRTDGLCRTPFLVGPQKPANLSGELQASIDMAADLGAPVLTIVTGGTEPGTKGVLESQKLLADRLAGAASYAADQGINLALEPLNPMFGGNRTCIMTVRDALAVCEMVAAPNLGIAVDVYHVWWDTALAAACETAGSRIFGLHLCDWLQDTDHMLLDRGMMGDGVADIRAIRRAVENAGYAQACEVEIFSADNWWKRSPGEVLDVVVERFRTVC